MKLDGGETGGDMGGKMPLAKLVPVSSITSGSFGGSTVCGVCTSIVVSQCGVESCWLAG